MNPRPVPNCMLVSVLPGVVLSVIGLALSFTGCRKKEESPAPPPTSPTEATSPTIARRAAATWSPLPRMGLDAIWDDPDDDPELTEDYYSGEAESDGANEAAPADRPDESTLPAGRSFSVGPPNGGWLIRGQALPLRGPHFRVLPGTARRKWIYGTDNLVRVLRVASAAVGKAHPPAVLRVGNLSRAQGGKITPSVSHQSGRDADIGLYCTDLDDNPVDPAGFPKFDGSRGPLVDRTGRYLFDVKRNWAFVEALLESKRVRMQWVFLDTPLKEALLDYAIRTGASSQSIDKAEKLIVRPRNSSPHANHFHIRIFCDEGDLEYGCRDYGPEWSWVKEQRQARRQYLSGRVDRIMRGEEKLDLSEGGKGSSGKKTTPKPGRGMDEMKDPPTGVDLKL